MRPPNSHVNWIWQPVHVYEIIAARAGVVISLNHYDEIQANALLRDEWIAEFKLMEQEAEKKQQEQAIQYKLEILNSKDDFSEESDSD